MRYAVLIGIVLIAIPLLARIQTDEPFPDARSYEGLRQAELDSYDSLYNRPYHPTISDWLFSNIKPQVVLIVLAAIALLCASLLYGSEAFLLLIATSPAMLATFTRVGEGALGITIIAAGALLLSKRHYWALLFIPVCFSLSFSIGIIAGVSFISIALLHRLPFVALGASFISLLSGVIAVVLYPERTLGLTIPKIGQILGIFGSADGVTIFLLFLGVIGFLLTWRATKDHAHVLALLALPCVLFFDHGTFVLAIFSAFYAAKAWEGLSQRAWAFEELQGITLVLIMCGILFTTIVVEKQLYVIDQGRIDAVRFVTTVYPQGTIIYAGPDIAPILAYRGYPASDISLDKSAGFIASTLANNGYTVVVSKERHPPFAHFPIVYEQYRNPYKVYEVPIV